MRKLTWLSGLLLFGLPLTLLFFFTHYPAGRSLFNSFWSTGRGRRKSVFVGAENYERLLSDETLQQVLWNNLIYGLVTIPLAIAIAIAMALLVNSRIPARSLMRLSFFMPTMLPMIAVANIWLFFYAPGFGLLGQILTLAGFEQVNLVGRPESALWAMMAVTIWKEAGFFMIFYLAALQSMPPNLSEAAAIEGAGRLRIFWKITFPLLGPTTLFVAINALINAFRMVDHIIVMTKGGPNNASALLLYYIYETAFAYWDTAYGATLTVLMVVIMGVIAMLQYAMLERRTHYQ